MIDYQVNPDLDKQNNIIYLEGKHPQTPVTKLHLTEKSQKINEYRRSKFIKQVFEPRWIIYVSPNLTFVKNMKVFLQQINVSEIETKNLFKFCLKSIAFLFIA